MRLALPSTPCGGISLMLIDFVVAEGIASAEATKGLSDRPLETFGAGTPMQLDFYRCRGISRLQAR